MSELPKGWFNSELCDVAEVVSGNAFKSKDFVENGIPVVKISNVQSGEYIEKNQEYLPESFNNKDNSRFIVTYNDLLIALTRPIVSNKLKVCTYPNKSQVGLLNQRVARLDVNEGFSKRFLHYYLSSKEFRESVQASMSETLQPNLSPKSLSKINIACPPLAEQQRIVDKLDEVLAQVDTIKARLDGIPAILKRFRQSVLASAVSGKLTVSEAPRQMSCLKKLGKIAGGKTPSKAKSVFWNGDVLWVSPKDMKTDFIDDSLDRISELAISEGGMKYVPENSLLMVTRSGILAHTFPVALATKKLTINQDIKAFTPDTNLILPEFGLYLIKGLAPRILAECSKTGTTVASVETKLLESIEFELPTIKEQQEIVRLVDQYFAFADTIEAQVKKAQARVDNLTQSILAKAFRGELVAQDPNGEPADKLLERIAQARKEAEALAKAAKKTEAAKKRTAKSV
ncbi:restriction endonuclease subunit S [Vibrio vulnificus]|nr:restriction endonuclease subunit S [Vibrio vulnificus]